ncbi:MAG: hypothetical protein R3C28_27175 [Pirellulaceae bacterium]
MRSFEVLEDRQMLTVSLVSDINTQPADSDIQFVASLDDVEIFLADDGIHGRELWRTDGTTVGTYRLLEQDLAGWSVKAAVATQQVFLLIEAQGVGDVLYVSDGTANGTRRINELISLASSSIDTPVAVGDDVVFLSFDFDPAGRRIWRTDGSVEGTHSISTDVLPQGSSQVVWGIGGTALLYAGNAGRQLLALHSEDKQTVLLSEFPSPSSLDSFTSFGETALFVARVGGVTELWTTDGTRTGTFKLASIRNIQTLTKIGDHIYFVGNDGIHGNEVWRTDGTVDGTAMVRDIAPGFPGSTVLSCCGFGAVGDRIVFSATNSEFGNQVWGTDGTEVGTEVLTNTQDGAFNATALVEWNGFVYFAGRVGQVWRTDGTPQGTEFVTEVSPGFRVEELIVAGEQLVVLAREPGANDFRHPGLGCQFGTSKFFVTGVPRDKR